MVGSCNLTEHDLGQWMWEDDVGTIVGFVSGRKIIVFLQRVNNCRVCTWQESRCFSVAREQLKDL